MIEGKTLLVRAFTWSTVGMYVAAACLAGRVIRGQRATHAVVEEVGRRVDALAASEHSDYAEGYSDGLAVACPRCAKVRPIGSVRSRA